MKTVGIIGGLGPEGTADFYLQLISLCQEHNQVNRPPILMWNVPITYEAERDEIMRAVIQEEVKELLVSAARILEKGGADFLVMPCNSHHGSIDRIKNAVSIPVLNILEETVKFLKEREITRFGLMASLITRENALYKDLFNSYGMEYVLPSDLDQTKLDKIILNLTLGQHNEIDREELGSVIDNLEKEGIENVVLACTDFNVLGPTHPRVKIYDNVKIFAEATARRILED